MKDDTKFRLKMMETVDEETLEWAQKASKEFAKRMSYYKCAMLEVETRFHVLNLSPNGHTETIANAFCRMLPRDTYVANLEENGTAYADVQLVGFEMGGTKLDAIPFKVLEYLEGLEGKIIFLFATVPFQPNDAVRNKVNNSVIPFLPDECDYRGLYLCAAQPPESLIRDLRNVIASQPDNTRAKQWLEQCEKANGHPNTNDLNKGCQFMRHVLELDT